MRAGIITIMLLLAVNVWAAPKGRELPRTAPESAHVGTLDGAEVESLVPLDSPTVSETTLEKMPDTTLAKELEKAREWALAALEWQRVAQGAKGKGRLVAIERAAKSYDNAAEKNGAARLWQRLAAESEGQQRVYALYRLSLVTEGDEQREIIANLKAFGGPWGEAVLYRGVWAQAQKGPVIETYGLPKAEQLKQQLADADLTLKRRAARAAAFGVIPGLGHAYLGKTSTAAALLTAWSLMGWLFLWCWRRKWWPFVALWMLPFSVLWGTSPGMAGSSAEQQNIQLRADLLAQWSDLHPANPPEMVEKPIN